MDEANPLRSGHVDTTQRFPRGVELPSQSPVFWVGQKDRYLRQLLIRDIEQISGRRLVVYFANRFVRGSDIDAGDVALFAELLGDARGQPIDLMIETNGGQTDATEAIISLIHQTCPDIRVVIANAAKSSGTMLSLASQCIVMGPPSELGPIEPSVGPFPASTLISEVVREKDFPLHIAGIHALRQARLLAQRLLATGMMKAETNERIEEATSALSTRETYPSHGSVIDRYEAQRLGLHVKMVDPGDPFWDRIWLLYCMYDFDARRAGYTKIFEGRFRSLALVATQATAT